MPTRARQLWPRLAPSSPNTPTYERTKRNKPWPPTGTGESRHVGRERVMKVAVVAEFYPRRGDPVLGVWAHRQALAARDGGAEVRVLVLHRLIPPRASFANGPANAVGELTARAREPRSQVRDGIPVTYVPFVSPPRQRSYATWGAWAAPTLGLALRRL